MRKINVLKKWLSRFPLFLITIPAFITIHIERRYHGVLIYDFLYDEILQLLLASFVIFLFSWLLFRTRDKATIASLIILLPYYFFSDIKDSFRLLAGDSFFSKYQFQLPVLFAIVVLLLIRLKRQKKINSVSILFTNLLSLLFIMSEAVMIALAEKPSSLVSSAPIIQHLPACDTCLKPDIYHLVFDSYTSSAALAEEFNYANGLDTFLSQKGFYVASNSVSNYNLTPFSISSCFELNYLDRLDTSRVFTMNRFVPGISEVYETRLVNLLKNEGYTVVNNSIFRMKDHAPAVPLFDLWEFELLYERYHLFMRMDKDIGWMIRVALDIPPRASPYHLYRDVHLDNVYAYLQKTILRQASRPRFVYSHFMVPHYPYTFDSAGNKIMDLVAMSEEEDKGRYLGQLIYTNKLITAIIDSIFSNSRKPFVIILQGDHGYKSDDPAKKLYEFSNLNAIYFPDRDYRLLRQNISSVNTYRVVFNTIFKKEMPLLPDKNIYLRY